MNNLDKNYQNLLKEILDNGVKKETRNGEVISIFGSQIKHKMSEGFPMLTTKKMYFKGILTELLWFLRGDTNVKFLLDNNCNIWNGDLYKAYEKKYDRIPKLIGDNYEKLNKEDFIERLKVDKKFLSEYGDFGPIYGKQWRSWEGKGDYRLPDNVSDWVYTESGLPVTEYKPKQIDQITSLIHNIKTEPDSRRLMVSAWNVGELDQMVLPPCHYGFQVYTRELTSQERKNLYDKSEYEKDTFPTDENGWNELFDDFDIPERAISLMWNQRSVDTFLGLPFNITSYGLLLEIFGKCVNMAPDLLIGNLGDVHLYSNHIEQAKEQISREPYELPRLEINDEFWNYLHTKNEDANILVDSIKIQDFMILDYKSHPKLEGALSN